ncbi:sensor histidine kinase [Polaribacter ponticola]|uniref:Histidine kinase n=1 Tax=Polaribacter ponticola TaxID=2978475 RepID=A0ABT5S727_9FLAO|nr:histidine kinase [Polaribacter sp. MSW5]MDD7913902.1 histidine kinase [Polaribacter sp. MSW5]
MISFISFLFVCYVLVDFYIKKNKKISNDRISALKQENHLLTLEQKALQLQMNPHFIFNVLNGIKALGNTGKIDELNKTISQFSVLLRSILNNSRKEEISLQEEIDYLKNYIELEQNMSSKLFTFQIHTNLNNIDPEEILIPSMLIQPFIENCIKHGIQLNKEGKIDVNFDVIHNFLNCTIIDNGIGFNQSKKENQNHSSIAIKVSKERIEKISTKNSFLINEVVEATKIKGTKVWFKIPLKTDY